MQILSFKAFILIEKGDAILEIVCIHVKLRCKYVQACASRSPSGFVPAFAVKESTPCLFCFACLCAVFVVVLSHLVFATECALLMYQGLTKQTAQNVFQT